MQIPRPKSDVPVERPIFFRLADAIPMGSKIPVTPYDSFKILVDPVPWSGVYTTFQKASLKMKSLTIGHLAKEAGVNLETVRYYERTGLLPKPPRSASGYRLFSSDAARRLRFIRRAQELGFSLKEIRELLSLRVSRTTTSRDIRVRAEAKIVDIDAKIRSLESMKKTLRKLTNVCDGCAPLAECPILDSLDRETT